MPTYLQAVDMPERCFLHEVLLWVAFRRLPVSIYTIDGKDIRDTPDVTEVAGYGIDWIGPSFLSEEETQHAGIPPDPSWLAFAEDRPDLPVSHYDRILSIENLDDDRRAAFLVQRKQADEFHAAREEWNQRHYLGAIEYPVSKIFIALRDGNLRAKGRRLEGPDVRQALDSVDEKGKSIFEIEPTDIPTPFWRLRGIEFDTSSASNSSVHYCHITFYTEDVLAAFPCEGEEVHSVVRVGETFILDEKRKTSSHRNRGRPAYSWDRFHIEVAKALHRSELPLKKEAAIEHFQAWFQRELGYRPSRAAVGEKLKPYYDQFVRGGGQKNN